MCSHFRLEQLAFAETQDQTTDLQSFSLTLSQLSYFGKHSCKYLQFSVFHYMMKVLWKETLNMLHLVVYLKAFVCLLTVKVKYSPRQLRVD